MHFTIVKEEGVLRAEVYGRKSAEELRQVIAAVDAEVGRTGTKKVIVCVRNSHPVFRVDQTGIPEQFRRIAADPQYRVALLADSDELRKSHEYIEVLARQQNAGVRAFRDEAAALAWLNDQSQEKR
jgi:hypothetical protein